MKPKKSAGTVLIAILLLLLAAIMFIPFWQIIVITFSTTQDYLLDPSHLKPTHFDTSVMTSILQSAGLQRGALLSVFVTVVGWAISMFLTVAGAYALSHKQLPGRRLILTLMIVTMYFSGGIIPMYVLLKRLNILNSVFALFMPYALNTFYLMLVKNYIGSLSPEMEEAARIDGCNDVGILCKVMIPLCKPVLLTVSMFYIVNYWNDYFSAMMYVDSPELYPLSLIMRNVIISRTTAVNSLAGMAGSSPTEQYTKALILISMIPVLALYPSIQKYFTTGIMVGALKD